ncbi:MAG: hypothetical protein JO295_01940 [Verrucomicrobia bacterium]|nr:hypothetical protein [Verrucomicrobiota bacterium]
MKSVITLILLLLVAARRVHAQAPEIADAPKAIQHLAAVIQGKPPDDVRAEIIRQFGHAQRNVGSGFRIEQWDVFGGVLTFHPATGPTFSDPKANRYFRLLRTSNPIGANILDGYEMTTLPDPKPDGTRFWLGNLKFGSDGTYRFIDSRQHPNHRAEQRDNFFMLYPAGTVKVRYVHPVSSDTPLESLPEDTVVAHLNFTSADHKHQATFSITSSERARRLTFGADTPLSFYMDGWWKSFWQ